MELNVRTQTLNLKCSRFESNIKGLDAQDFPLIPPAGGDNQVTLEPSELRAIISQVAFAAATDESRPVLTGVLARFDDGKLTLAAAILAAVACLRAGRGTGVDAAGLVAVLATLAAGAIAGYDLGHLNNLIQSHEVAGVAQVGWGPYAVVGGAVLTFGALLTSMAASGRPSSGWTTCGSTHSREGGGGSCLGPRQAAPDDIARKRR